MTQNDLLKNRPREDVKPLRTIQNISEITISYNINNMNSRNNKVSIKKYKKSEWQKSLEKQLGEKHHTF